MRKKRVWLLGLVMCMMVLSGLTASAQDYQKTQHKLKSIFIYNFLKHVSWPSYNNDQKINICLLGEDAIFSELSNLASTKKVQGRSLEVKKIGGFSDCAACDLMFVNAAQASQVSERPGDCNSFIVTDNEFVDHLSNINLKYKDNRLGFEINSGLCDRLGYQVGSELKTLAF